MERYQCIEPFSIQKYDEDENIVENEEIQVHSGSEWFWEKDRIASMGEVRLDNDTNWLEISKEMFTSYFRKMELPTEGETCNENVF
jgi:hypothetical protein